MTDFALGSAATAAPAGAANARKPSTWFMPKFNSPIAPA